MYFVKTPKLFTKIFPDVIWECPIDRPEYHLTFDDGPSENTDRILDFLAEQNITASFFCLGQQIEKYPKAFKRIISEGHIVGNHSYSHLNGWKTPFDKYIEDVELGFKISQATKFRPPFGKLTCKQYKYLKEKYQIVMWTLMPGDFDSNISIQTCKTRLSKANHKDIIVLHDHSDSDIMEILNILNRKKSVR